MDVELPTDRNLFRAYDMREYIGERFKDGYFYLCFYRTPPN